VSLFSEEVAAGVKAGDPKAIEVVYTVLADRLLSYLCARVRDRATAEDLVEATFLELLQKGWTIRGGAAAIKVWLFRSAHFNALDHHRRMSRRPEDLFGDPARIEAEDHARGPEELAVAADEAARVQAALACLSSEQREVLELRYGSGLSAPEIGRVLGKNDGAVRSLQHRGERSLAKLLASEESGDTRRPMVMAGRRERVPAAGKRRTPSSRAHEVRAHEVPGP
jgi:RNA polymerase sigma-70 factor (ECF subfamily)